MKRLAVVCAFLVWCGSSAFAASSPVGFWLTFDDDGKETGKVEIFEAGKLLYGRIVGIADPAKAQAVCRDCKDDRKNQPVLGLQFMRGLQPDGDRWAGGEILDPQNGKVYGCSMHVEDDGRKLVVRGFLGISLLGRTQTWLRAK